MGKSVPPGEIFRRRIFEVRFSVRLSAPRRRFQKLFNNKKGGHVIGAGGSMGIDHRTSW